MWTGDATLAPLEGELMETLCAEALAARSVATAVQQNRNFLSAVDVSRGSALNPSQRTAEAKKDFEKPIGDGSENKQAYTLRKTTSNYAIRDCPNRNGRCAENIRVSTGI